MGLSIERIGGVLGAEILGFQAKEVYPASSGTGRTLCLGDARPAPNRP